MPRVLTVEPTAGLGNRLRVIAASVAMAKSLGCRLRIVWTRTTDLSARFHDLFEEPPGFSIVESSWTRSRLRRYALRPWFFDAYHDDRSVMELSETDEALRGIEKRRHPFIISCLRFYPGVLHKEALPAAPGLRDRVADVTRSFPDNIVGVHVRRTDQGLSIEHSPTHAFLEAMRQAVAKDPSTEFFLASDSPSDVRHISDAFPGRVTALRSECDRTLPRAAQDALVDMECLGHCSYILGSYFSSFSEIAAERGRIPLCIVRSPSGARA